MHSKMNMRFSAVAALAAMTLALLAGAQAVSRLVGTVTAINGTTLTVKTDNGDVHQIEVPAAAPIKRIAPGQKDLSTAQAIAFSDLATGDRVLVRLDSAAAGATAQALQIIAIKQSDVEQKQQKDREEWQRRGVGGLVKSVDAASGTIVLSSGFGATAKTIAVHTTKSTMLKRYAPASVRFDAAVPAPLDAIHPGDQLRARGNKNADGTELEAEEAISGSFRNISGTVVSVDATSSAMVVKDLATKKQVTVHVGPDAQMRRLPERMAQMLAARLKGTASGSTSGASPGNGVSAESAAAAPGAPRAGEQWTGQGGRGQGAPGQFGGAGGGQGGAGGGDTQQMLTRLPPIQLADLRKGDAVMLVSTDGTAEVTGITLLAGVEPLLEVRGQPKPAQQLESRLWRFMFVHFRKTFEELNRAEIEMARLRLAEYMEPASSYLSMVELALQAYPLNRRLNWSQRVAENDEAWNGEISAQLARQREGDGAATLAGNIRTAKYICFYPMDREAGKQVNWYQVPMAERQRMMHEHGMVGLRYADEVKQIITGSIGFDDWEWGVDLFAEDPLVFKKLIYEMRFDEVSAAYALFGTFYVGVRVTNMADVLKG